MQHEPRKERSEEHTGRSRGHGPGEDRATLRADRERRECTGEHHPFDPDVQDPRSFGDELAHGGDGERGRETKRREEKRERGGVHQALLRGSAKPTERMITSASTICTVTGLSSSTQTVPPPRMSLAWRSWLSLRPDTSIGSV